jgi:hypothetical protein
MTDKILIVHITNIEELNAVQKKAGMKILTSMLNCNDITLDLYRHKWDETEYYLDIERDDYINYLKLSPREYLNDLHIKYGYTVIKTNKLNWVNI